MRWRALSGRFIFYTADGLSVLVLFRPVTPLRVPVMVPLAQRLERTGEELHGVAAVWLDVIADLSRCGAPLIEAYAAQGVL